MELVVFNPPYFVAVQICNRGNATLELAVSVGRSVGNIFDFKVFRSCPPVRDCLAVHPALFFTNFNDHSFRILKKHLFGQMENP